MKFDELHPNMALAMVDVAVLGRVWSGLDERWTGTELVDSGPELVDSDLELENLEYLSTGH